MTQRRVLVTGGAGFIGSHLVDALVQEGHAVAVVDDLSSTGSRRNLRSAVAMAYKTGAPIPQMLVRSILSDGDWPGWVEEKLGGPPKAIFHLAAIPSVARSVRDPEASVKTNVLGTLRVLGAAHAWGCRVVQASSSSVYGGIQGGGARTENERPMPLSPYAASKAAAEHLASSYAHCFGLSIASLRFFNVFGPRQDPNSQYAAVVPAFVTRALQGEPLTVHGDGKQSRDFTPVWNVVSALLTAARQSTRISGAPAINIGMGRSHSLLDLISCLSAILNRELTAEHEPRRPGDPDFSEADIGLATSVLSYSPHVSFEEGLRKTVAWFQNVQERS